MAQYSQAPDASGTRIYQQIEQAADYYTPSVYLQNLTFHHSIEMQVDNKVDQFIPISDVFNNPDIKKKLFVIGLIPPEAATSVTGKLLDRSAAIANLNPNASTDPALAKALSQNITSSSNGGPPTNTNLTYQQAAAAMSAAYQKMFGRQPTQQELAIYVAQSNAETGGNGSLSWPDNNPGFIGNYPPGDPRLGKTQTFFNAGTGTYFNAYSSPQAGAQAFLSTVYSIGGNSAIQAAQKGDVAGYTDALRRYYGGVNKDGTPNETVYNQYTSNIQNGVGFIQKQIGDPNNLGSVSLPGPTTIGPPNQVDPSTSTAWANSGSSANSDRNLQNALSQNTNLNNTTNTGQKFAEAQRSMAKATQDLLTKMANTPPLQLLVNPQSFKVSNEKIISDGNWTRYGPATVVEHWGDQQDKIEASGKIAAFMALDTTTDQGGPGMTRTARQYSASYQNFVSLYQIYRNNAGLFLPDNVESTDIKKQNMSQLGSIYIYYDHTLYVGSFDSFTISETDSAPFTLEYSFSFTVRATFLLDQVSDPNHTYGIPQGGFTVQQPQSVPTSEAATLAQNALNEQVQNDFFATLPNEPPPENQGGLVFEPLNITSAPPSIKTNP